MGSARLASRAAVTEGYDCCQRGCRAHIPFMQHLLACTCTRCEPLCTYTPSTVHYCIASIVAISNVVLLSTSGMAVILQAECVNW